MGFYSYDKYFNQNKIVERGVCILLVWTRNDNSFFAYLLLNTTKK